MSWWPCSTRFPMALNRQILIKFLAPSAVLGALLLYLFLYAPLIGELKRQSRECLKIEAETALMRSRVTGFRAQEMKGGFISEAEVSVAIDELAHRGKLHRVKFSSLTPNPSEKREGAVYRILPVELVTESGYEGLGRFLGALDEIQKGIVTVEDFTVKSDHADPGRLEAKLTLHLHLAE